MRGQMPHVTDTNWLNLSLREVNDFVVELFFEQTKFFVYSNLFSSIAWFWSLNKFMNEKKSSTIISGDEN